MGISLIIIGAIAAGAALSAVAAIQQGQAAKKAGQAQAAIAEHNAKLKERQAVAAREQAREQADRFKLQGKQLQGKQKVALAKGGVLAEVGTPALVLEETAQNLEDDRLAILREGFLRGSFAESEAEGLRAQGRAAIARGKNAQIGSFLSAGGTLLTGLGAAGYAAYSLPTKGANLTTLQKSKFTVVPLP